jgi:uncharacterized protein YecA (UPF0149 family)
VEIIKQLKTNQPETFSTAKRRYDKMKIAGSAILHKYNTNQTAGPSRPRIKVGRNEPCPCGSGKKYKKCCGA